MAQEQIFADFSGGMNAIAAVDKLDPKECLLAENVRLDETGNVQSAGALTAQNTSSYADSSSTTNVHSLFWNPSIGAVAGVGKDVFTGPTLGGMTDKLIGSNMAPQKMSFASAPGKVYFDVGSTGEWTDMNNLLTVDWQPPVAIGGTITGPTSPGTAVQVGDVYFTIPWTTPENIVSTSSALVASCSFTSVVGISEYVRATMSTNSFAISTAAVTGIAVALTVLTPFDFFGQFQVTLLKGGIPVGDLKPWVPQVGNVPTSHTFGGSSDLWNVAWAQADINAGNFGVQIAFLAPNGAGLLTAFGATITIYQGAGFTAGTGAGGNLSGTYSYKITFVSGNGEESDASNESNQVILSSNQGTLTAIQTGDARTVARNIYRTGGALTSHYIVGTIQDNITTTYSDNQTDLAALSEGIILAGDIPGDYPNSRLGSTQVRFPELHYDRVFWINQAQTNQLIWSKPLNGFAYPSINFINVGDSKPISRIVSIFGELIIIKTDSIWRLTGTDESSFDLTRTPSAVGTDMPFTIVALPDKIVFTNRYGPWVFNGYTSQPLTPKLDLWFRQQDRSGNSIFGNGFHPPEVASATVPLLFEAVGNSEKYVLAYAEAGQTTNHTSLIFDLKHGNITKRTGRVPLSLAIDPVNGFVYQGDSTGFVSLLDDWNGTNQHGASVNLDFQTGYIDLQRGSNKALWALEFFINTGGQSITPIIYFDNGANVQILPAITTSDLQRVVRPIEVGNSRKMQNFSVRLNGSLSVVNVSGTPTVDLVHIKAKFDIRTGRAREGQ